MQTLLAHTAPADVRGEPFPHVIVPSAVDPALCDDLVERFPPTEVLSEGAPLGSNKRAGLSASQVVDNAAVDPVWRDFIAAHVGQAFLGDLVRLFGEQITATYPNFERDVAPLADLRVGIRKVDDFTTADVLLDAQISINTPVTGPPSSVRTTHLDAPTKLFAGLFYLRRPEDTSTGGDLELLRYRSRPRGFRGPMVYSTFVETVATVPYERNMLVVFLNSPTALHGVTVRSRTDVPRCFVNIVAEVERPLFDMTPLQATARDKVAAGREIVGRRLRVSVG